jgi:hypothetical protein
MFMLLERIILEGYWAKGISVSVCNASWSYWFRAF